MWEKKWERKMTKGEKKVKINDKRWDKGGEKNDKRWENSENLYTVVPLL
jgi:hypothetical protein